MGKGIYTRGFLPHWDYEKSTQAITFRLADSLPVEVIQDWNCELATIPESSVREKELHRRIAKYEDAGSGSAVFTNPHCAVLIQSKLIEGHSSRYSLIDWCIMPNHVHVLIRLMENQSLADIVKFWKGGSAIEINRISNGKAHFGSVIIMTDMSATLIISTIVSHTFATIRSKQVCVTSLKTGHSHPQE